MKEEMNRREAELTEAALESVSGGSGHEERLLDLEHLAMNACGECARSGWPHHCEGGGVSALREYVRRNGGFESFVHCPFLRWD